MINNFIQPHWPAPANVHAYTSLRTGGVSYAPYDTFNLATHVGDDIEHVMKNRVLLKQVLHLPSEPIWIQQTHSTIALPAVPINLNKEADATFSDQAQAVCAVLTADCLPLLICNPAGTFVAAIHAGWRGLANGIVAETLRQAKQNNAELLVWLGPALGVKNFEVGPEVKALFMEKNPDTASAFTPSSKPNHWMADIYGLAHILLKHEGVRHIYGGKYCSYADATRFFSYRRDGAQTGRMVSLIWRD